MDFSELLVYERDLAACYEAEYLLTLRCCEASLASLPSEKANLAVNGTLLAHPTASTTSVQPGGILFQPPSGYNQVNFSSKLKDNWVGVGEAYPIDDSCERMDHSIGNNISREDMTRKRRFQDSSSFPCFTNQCLQFSQPMGQESNGMEMDDSTQHCNPGPVEFSSLDSPCHKRKKE